MITTIERVDDSLVLILDDALLELAGLKVGDQVDVTVRGDAITLAPLQDAPIRQLRKRLAKRSQRKK